MDKEQTSSRGIWRDSALMIDGILIEIVFNMIYQIGMGRFL